MAEIDLDQLITNYNQIQLKISEITASPKPNYDIDGQKISWGDYLKQLTEAAKALKQQIDENQEPFDFETELLC